MQRILLPVIVFAAGAALGYSQLETIFPGTPAVAAAAHDDDAAIASAFEKRAHKIRVEGRGTVVKVLPDDNDGSRHQRFLVRLRSGLTVLIAHNIDLAPRISSLRAGDAVSFSGEYEWNAKGGVIHWTHRDPHGRHPAGWIRRGGQSIQ